MLQLQLSSEQSYHRAGRVALAKTIGIYTNTERPLSVKGSRLVSYSLVNTWCMMSLSIFRCVFMVDIGVSIGPINIELWVNTVSKNKVVTQFRSESANRREVPQSR